MPTDLDLITAHGGEHEVFEPVNAWPDASARVFVQVNKMVGGSYQVGHDPETGKQWIRSGNAGAWNDWVALEPPPEPPAADEAAEDENAGDYSDDTYETADLEPKPKRGPGRPRRT